LLLTSAAVGFEYCTVSCRTSFAAGGGGVTAFE
jgi:hypothetical protein